MGSYCGAVHYSKELCWVTDNAIIAQAKEGVNPRFIYYLLQHLKLNEHRIGSGQPLLTQGILKNLETKRILREVQDAIAQLLGALDDKIAVNDRIAAAWERILRLRFAALEIDVETSSVDAISVSDLVEFNPRRRAPDAGDSVYLEMAALPTDSARIRSWSRRAPKSGTRFMNGDTVMARITPCLENGKTAYIDFLEDGEVGIGSTEFIVMRARDNVPSHLPYFLARSPRFREHAIRNMVGSSGRQRVAAASLTDIPLQRPDGKALADFAGYASSTFKYLKSLDAETRTLAELRDTLLPKLMSGEVRIRDAEKVVEDAV